MSHLFWQVTDTQRAHSCSHNSAAPDKAALLPTDRTRTGRSLCLLRRGAAGAARQRAVQRGQALHQRRVAVVEEREQAIHVLRAAILRV